MSCHGICLALTDFLHFQLLCTKYSHKYLFTFTIVRKISEIPLFLIFIVFGNWEVKQINQLEPIMAADEAKHKVELLSPS